MRIAEIDQVLIVSLVLKWNIDTQEVFSRMYLTKYKVLFAPTAKYQIQLLGIELIFQDWTPKVCNTTGNE